MLREPPTAARKNSIPGALAPERWTRHGLTSRPLARFLVLRIVKRLRSISGQTNRRHETRFVLDVDFGSGHLFAPNFATEVEQNDRPVRVGQLVGFQFMHFGGVGAPAPRSSRLDTLHTILRCRHGRGLFAICIGCCATAGRGIRRPAVGTIGASPKKNASFWKLASIRRR